MKEINCQNIEEYLDLAFSAELESNQQKSLEAHVAKCPQCQALWQEFQVIHQAMDQLEAQDAPSEMTMARIQKAAAEQIQTPPKKRGLAWWWRPTPSWIAAATLVLGVGLGMVSQKFISFPEVQKNSRSMISDVPEPVMSEEITQASPKEPKGLLRQSKSKKELANRIEPNERKQDEARIGEKDKRASYAGSPPPPSFAFAPSAPRSHAKPKQMEQEAADRFEDGSGFTQKNLSEDVSLSKKTVTGSQLSDQKASSKAFDNSAELGETAKAVRDIKEPHRPKLSQRPKITKTAPRNTEQKFGTLTIKSQPEGGEVYLNGNYLRTAPITIHKVPMDRELRIKLLPCPEYSDPKMTIAEYKANRKRLLSKACLQFLAKVQRAQEALDQKNYQIAYQELLQAKTMMKTEEIDTLLRKTRQKVPSRQRLKMETSTSMETLEIE